MAAAPASCTQIEKSETGFLFVFLGDSDLGDFNYFKFRALIHEI